MNNKAQIAESFKYIFGVIVGGMFLVFFIGFAFKYIQVSGEVSDTELAIDLDNQLTALYVTESASDTIPYNKKIEITILNNQIIAKNIGKQTDKIIYSPLTLKAEQIIIATKAFSLPYESTNLFYMTDQKTFYVIIYDQTTKEFAEEITNGYTSIPNNFIYDSFEYDILKNNLEELQEITKNYKVKFIFLTEETIDLDSYFEDYHQITINSFDTEYNYGEVIFPQGTSIYLTKEMLIGAIITEDKGSYDYNLNLALDRVKKLSQTYYEKTKLLTTKQPLCNYDPIKTNINNYNTFIDNSQSPLNFKNYIEAIETANKNLGGDCPEIY